MNHYWLGLLVALTTDSSDEEKDRRFVERALDPYTNALGAEGEPNPPVRRTPELRLVK